MKVTNTYNVYGMACAMCASAVKVALSQIPGVESAEIHLPEKQVTITYDDGTVSLRQLQAVVKGAGYDLVL